MTIRDSLIRGYYDEMNGEDYIVEIDSTILKKWFAQEELDLLDFEETMPKKIAVYKILEEEFTKNLDHYKNFTVHFE